MVKENLKPCPFCGCEDVSCEEYGRNVGMWYIQCHECCAVLPHFDSKQEAATPWNTRYEPPYGGSVPAGNERLYNGI